MYTKFQATSLCICSLVYIVHLPAIFCNVGYNHSFSMLEYFEGHSTM